MFKEKLGKVIIRILYILFAVILSVTLWVYVEITENEIQVGEVSNIEIEFVNSHILRDRGFFITSHTPQSLTVTFEAPRSEMARLRTAGALKAEVDVTSITSTGTHHLAYRLIYPSNVNTNTVVKMFASVERIELNVDTVLDRQIPVNAEYLGGTASDSLFAESAEFDPLFINVRGPERVVSRIKYLRVPIPRENLSATITEDFEFLVIDDTDNILDDELRALLEFSQDTVRVTVKITEMKDVPLTVVLAHGLSTSEHNTIVRIDPETVKISGDPVAVGNINSITLGTIDMTSFGLSTSETFPIIFPDNLTNVSGETFANVHVEVVGLEIAFLITSNFTVSSPPPGHQVEILTQTLDIRIRGHGEDLAQVTPLNLRVVAADISDRNPGAQRVPARVYIDGTAADIDPVGTYFLSIRIFVDED